jgi:hypothetical protein
MTTFKILVFVFSFGIFNFATAATYYVSTGGSDVNSGTQSTSAFRNISKGLNVAGAGDKILVMNGTYSEGLSIGKSGQPGAHITLAAMDGHRPIITNGGTVINIAVPGAANSPVGWITIEGFEITSSAPNKYGVYGISLYNAHDIIIRRNKIHHAGQGIGGHGPNITVEQNEIYHNGNFNYCLPDKCNLDHGIYATGSNWKIINNLIYDNLSHGIQMAGYAYNPARMPDSSYGGASGWLIANNTIAYQHYRSAIVVYEAGAVNSVIKNNIFYENDQQASQGVNGVEFYYCGGGHIVENNLFFASGAGATVAIWDMLSGAPHYTGSGNLLNSNPLFVNAGAIISGVPNFQLQPTSPARDKGQNISGITNDFLGNTRPQNGVFDIGAYEFVTATSTPTKPQSPTGLKAQ